MRSCGEGQQQKKSTTDFLGRKVQRLAKAHSYLDEIFLFLWSSPQEQFRTETRKAPLKTVSAKKSFQISWFSFTLFHWKKKDRNRTVRSTKSEGGPASLGAASWVRAAPMIPQPTLCSAYGLWSRRDLGRSHFDEPALSVILMADI